MKIRLFGRNTYLPGWVRYLAGALLFGVLVLAGFFIERSENSGELIRIRGNEQTEMPGDAESAKPGDAARETSGEGRSEESPFSPPPTLPPDLIFVYIVGEIRVSDVYGLPGGSIVNDLVQLAGGLTEEADREAVNLAFPLKNGMMIRIPSRDDGDKKWILDTGSGSSSSDSAPVGPAGTVLVNINTATVSELCTLPGIGESTALKIISYRTENGDFAKITDIMNVAGIKTAKYNEIKSYITVG